MNNFGVLIIFNSSLLVEILQHIGEENAKNVEVILAKRNQPMNLKYSTKLVEEILHHEKAHQGYRQPCQSLITPDIFSNKVYSKKNAVLLAEVCYGHTENCKIMMDHGALLDESIPHGRSPLFYAAYVGNIKICELLITRGEAIDKRDSYGETPLFAAASRGNTDVCELLITQGAKADLEQYTKSTPLLMAAAHGKVETCKLLVTSISLARYQEHC